ncbi:hypothetical protein ANN_15166, partial [Periplaneta americana]
NYIPFNEKLSLTMAFIFNSLVLDVLAFLCALFLVFYVYLTHTFNFWKNLGIPYIKPLPFVGNFKDVVLQKYGIGHYLKTVYDEHKDKSYIGIFAFHQPALVINDLDIIKSVLVKDAQVFINHKATVDAEKNPILHRTLFSLKGQSWKNMRLSLSPTFASGKMKQMFHLMDSCAKQLVQYLDNSKGSPVQMKDTMARFTTDVIASCALGIEINSLQCPDSEFRQILNNVFKPTLSRAFGTLLVFFSPSLVKVFRPKIIDDKVNSFMRDSVWSIVEYRPSTSSQLDSILPPPPWPSPFFELALHPEVQQRLRGEIVDTLVRHDHLVTYDGVQEMTYLDMVVSVSMNILTPSCLELSCIRASVAIARSEMALFQSCGFRTIATVGTNDKPVTATESQAFKSQYTTKLHCITSVTEVLRKYPTLPFLDRDSLMDYKLPAPSKKGSDTVTLPAGTAVYIPVMAIQHDPEYYPQPERFNPERFSEENKRSRPNFAYFPFGEGPRICIEMRFGLMQTKTGLIHILANYEVSPCKDTPVTLVFDSKSLLLTSEGEMNLTFTKIDT